MSGRSGRCATLVELKLSSFEERHSMQHGKAECSSRVATPKAWAMLF